MKTKPATGGLLQQKRFLDPSDQFDFAQGETFAQGKTFARNDKAKDILGHLERPNNAVQGAYGKKPRRSKTGMPSKGEATVRLAVNRNRILLLRCNTRLIE